jgi:PAS domain S-box-containing protein
MVKKMPSSTQKKRSNKQSNKQDVTSTDNRRSVELKVLPPKKRKEVKNQKIPKSAEAEIKKNEEVTQVSSLQTFKCRIFELSPVSMLICESNREIIEVNNASLELFNVNKKQVEEKPCERFFKEKDRIKTLFSDIIEKEHGFCEATLIRPDGSEVEVLFYLGLEKPESEIPKLFGLVIDVSRLHQANRTLETAKIYSERVIRNTPMPITVVSPDRKITDCNPATEALIGGKRTELIGREIDTFFAKESKEAVDAFIKEVLSSGSSQAELLLVRTDRKNVLVIANAAVIRDIQGNNIGVVIGLGDISEIKEREKELSEGMEEFGEVFGRISAGDLDARVDLKKLGSSLKVMGGHLNRVISTMEKQFSELQHNRDELEKERENIHRAVSSLNEVLSKAANGDLTSEVDVSILSGGLKEIGININKTLKELSQLINQARNMGGSVRETSKTILASAEGVSNSSQQMTNAIGQISKGASDQANLSANIKFGSDKLKQITQSVLSGVRTTSEKIAQVAEESKLGGEYASSAWKGSKSIADSFNAVADRVDHLGKSIEQITSITKVITDIADQTNLLALNAAIEAARAGEHGRAFAVVADEIRRLATESKESVSQIAQMIESMENEKDETVKVAKSSIESVNQGRDTIEKALAILQSIPKTIEEAASISNEINKATEDEAKAVENMDKQISEISLIAEENAASTEETSASTEELMASMEELTAVAERLGNTAEELMASLQNLNLKGEKND